MQTTHAWKYTPTTHVGNLQGNVEEFCVNLLTLCGLRLMIHSIDAAETTVKAATTLTGLTIGEKSANQTYTLYRSNIMKEIVTRLNPVAKSPVVFLVDTARDGQVDAFINGAIKRVGISDYYQHCLPMAPEDAHEVAKMFAAHENIPEDEIRVRVRLKKTFANKDAEAKPRQRRTNDANLKLVEGTAQDKPAPSDLQAQVQAWHDSETKKAEQRKQAKGEPAASAENPEGATVQDGRKKRSYNKKSPARQAAALRRYQQELNRVVAEQAPSVMTPAVPGPSVTQAEIDDADLQFALRLVKLLKGVM